MSMQNQKWSDISMLGRTQFKQAMLCNQYTKNLDSVFISMCVCIFLITISECSKGLPPLDRTIRPHIFN